VTFYVYFKLKVWFLVADDQAKITSDYAGYATDPHYKTVMKVDCLQQQLYILKFKQ